MKLILIYTYQWFITVIYNKGYDYGSVSIRENISLERAQEVTYFAVRNSIGGFVLLLYFYSSLLLFGPCVFNTSRILEGNLFAIPITLLFLATYGYIAKSHLKPIFKDIIPLETTQEELKKMNSTYLILKFLLPLLFVGFLLAGSYLIGQLEKYAC
ncbi:hypothetical protein [Galbibacter sp.]|jgi:hypothetical protein|uniref:hypothetical protein n=1 Tax=Galbibacter sp. TaxID=2918471 RepID=UPI003A93CFA4